MKRVAFITEFSREDSSVQSVVQAAAHENDAQVVSIDRLESEGHVVERLHRLLKKSDLVVASVYELSPNLLYEIGLAHGLGKPVILVAPRESIWMPADLRTQRVLYFNGRSSDLSGLGVCRTCCWKEIADEVPWWKETERMGRFISPRMER